MSQSFQDEYAYYGVISWDEPSALISITAIEDETNVRVYSLPGDILISEFNLDAMAKRFIRLPKGTHFKVASNKIASVMLFTHEDPPERDGEDGPVLSGFLTSADGNYVGKEYTFMASQILMGEFYHIFSLEAAEINLKREDGSEISFRMEANSHKQLRLRPFSVYRVESTGNIMIQAGELGKGEAGELTKIRSFFVPSAEGGFMGRRFYTDSKISWYPWVDDGFRISAIKDSRVRIWDLDLKKVIDEVEVKGGTSIVVKPEADIIAIESDGYISLSYIYNETRSQVSPVLRVGVGYISVKPNRESLFFIPLKSLIEAYILAYEDATVIIDDLPVTVRADSYFRIAVPGLHQIRSDKDILIQVVQWAEMSPRAPFFYRDFGVAVPCIQTVNESPNVKLSPIAGEGPSPIYIIAGAVAAVASTCLILMMIKRRRRQGMPRK